MTSALIPLTDEAILDEFADQPNRWPLKDIVVLAHGFDYRSFDWSKADGNSAPRRPYENAEIAIDRGELRGRRDEGGYQVTKKDFIAWLKIEYGLLTTFRRFIDLYDRYKATQQVERPASFFTKSTVSPTHTMLRVWNIAYNIGVQRGSFGKKFIAKDAAICIAEELGLPSSSVATFISQGGIRKMLIEYKTSLNK